MNNIPQINLSVEDVIKMHHETPMPKLEVPYNEKPIEEEKEFEDFLIKQGFELVKAYRIPNSSGMAPHKKYVNWNRNIYIILSLERGKGDTNFYYCHFGIILEHSLSPKKKNSYKRSFDYCKEFLETYEESRRGIWG